MAYLFIAPGIYLNQPLVNDRVPEISNEYVRFYTINSWKYLGKDKPNYPYRFH